jgi:hypothetical protein
MKNFYTPVDNRLRSGQPQPVLNLKMKSLNEIVAETPGLLVNGDWVCLNIDTRTSWPTMPLSFVFEGHQLWVMPLTRIIIRGWQRASRPIWTAMKASRSFIVP